MKNHLEKIKKSIRSSIERINTISVFGFFFLALKAAGVPLPLSYTTLILIILWPVTVLFGLAALMGTAYIFLAGTERTFKMLFGEFWYQRLGRTKAKVRTFLQETLENISDIFEP